MTADTQAAAVLVPVYLNDKGRMTIVLLRRSNVGTYGDQIAFPGGKQDDEDADLAATALREAREEIGLDPGLVVELSELPKRNTVSTNYCVYPFVARLSAIPELKRCEREVADIVHMTVDQFMDARSRKKQMMQARSWAEPRLMDVHVVGGIVIWGLTFEILQDALQLLTE